MSTKNNIQLTIEIFAIPEQSLLFFKDKVMVRHNTLHIRWDQGT